MRDADRHPETMKTTRRWTDVVRASRPLWHGHPARARERDAPATTGGTPAPRFSEQLNSSLTTRQRGSSDADDPLARPAPADEDAGCAPPSPISGVRWTPSGSRNRTPPRGRGPNFDCPLPTADCPLPTADCRLPTAYCLLPTALWRSLRAVSSAGCLTSQDSSKALASEAWPSDISSFARL